MRRARDLAARELTVATARECGKCGRQVVSGQPDPCLGWLPGVDYACCGHGGSTGYVRFSNGVTIRFPVSKIEQPGEPVEVDEHGRRVVTLPWRTVDEPAVARSAVHPPQTQVRESPTTL